MVHNSLIPLDSTLRATFHSQPPTAQNLGITSITLELVGHDDAQCPIYRFNVTFAATSDFWTLTTVAPMPCFSPFSATAVPAENALALVFELRRHTNSVPTYQHIMVCVEGVNAMTLFETTPYAHAFGNKQSLILLPFTPNSSEARDGAAHVDIPPAS